MFKPEPDIAITSNRPILAKSVICSSRNSLTIAFSSKFSIAGIERRLNMLYGGLVELEGYKDLFNPIRIYSYLVTGDSRYIVSGLTFKAGESAFISMSGKRIYLKGSGLRLWRVAVKKSYNLISMSLYNNKNNDYSSILRYRIRGYPSVVLTAFTSKGPRDINEDSYGLIRLALCKKDFNINIEAIIVADGAGGLGNGGLASGLTASGFASGLIQQLVSGNRLELDKIFEFINNLVVQRARIMKSNMASTIATAIRKDNKLLYGGVGDSKILSISTNGIKELGEMHRTVIGGSQALTSYIGSSNGLRSINLGTVTLANPTIVVALTDGVHDLISNEEIALILQHSSSVSGGVKSLIREALRRGTTDNATVAAMAILRPG